MTAPPPAPAGPVAAVEVVGDGRARLGEGPVWDDRAGALYWVDIRAPALHRYEPGSGAIRTWPMPAAIGSVALHEPAGLLVALRSGLHLFDPDTGALDLLPGTGPLSPPLRYNDGRCDPGGRFWVGSMHERGREPVGALHCLAPGRRWRRVRDGLAVPNGLGWSPDGRTMYFTDTPTRTILAFAADPETGALGPGRVFAVVPEEAGYPDGATVDGEGGLWSAHWDGWRITRYAPDGRVDRVVWLPVQRPTSCAFGGSALDALYVTSARAGLDDEALREGPLAGAVLVVHPGARGRPEPRVRD